MKVDPLDGSGFCCTFQFVRSQPVSRAMASTKTATQTFRILPEMKDAFSTAAQRERRSISNMAGIPIRDDCARNDIPRDGTGPDKQT